MLIYAGRVILIQSITKKRFRFDQWLIRPHELRQFSGLLLENAELNVPCSFKAMSHAAIFSCNLQRNGVSSCLLQEKSPPVNTSLVCKIIRLQVIQQLAYTCIYNSTGARNIFFTQTCVPSCKKKLPRVTAPLAISYTILLLYIFLSIWVLFLSYQS